MIGKTAGKIPFLFILYFLFLWGGQFSSVFAAKQLSAMNFYLIPLYFCFFSRAIIWFLILQKVELIKAYTLSSLNFLIIPLLSLLVLGEPVQMKHIVGGLCIVSGIILFSVGKQRLKTPISRVMTL